MRILIALLLALAISVLAACGAPAPSGTAAVRTPAPPPNIGGAPAPPIRDGLPNVDCPIDMTPSKRAPLKKGIYEEPIAPGAATNIKIQLAETRAFGDLNTDGAEDAAIMLTGAAGGHSNFSYVSLVMNDRGVPKCVGTALVGDLIVVNAISIQGDKVVVSMLDRKPGENFAAPPTVVVVRTFRWTADGLTEVK